MGRVPSKRKNRPAAPPHGSEPDLSPQDGRTAFQVVCECVSVCVVGMNSWCVQELIFRLQLNPTVRERKTIVISASFSQRPDPVLFDPPLPSGLHPQEEKVTCHRKCNKHVLEKLFPRAVEPLAISYECEIQA